MKLFVDDDPGRHIVFAKRHPGSLQTMSIVVAKNDLLVCAKDVSELWLDYDLGSAMAYGSFFDKETGMPCGSVATTTMPLVQWLCETPYVRRDLPIVLHSWNSAHASCMRAFLEAAGYSSIHVEPFSFKEVQA